MPIKANERQANESSQFEEVIDGSNLAKRDLDSKNVPTYQFQALIPDAFVFPGFKVRDKLSGLELLVIGFTDETDTISTNRQIKYNSQIYQKVYCNVHKKTDFELFGGVEDKKFYYHYFSNILHSWEDRVKYADELYFVCKYLNVETDEYRYYLYTFFEVERI